MADALIFDTTFLIDVQRERARQDGSGPAHRFLQGHADASMQLPVTALGEFAEGFADHSHPVLRATVALFEVLAVDAETALRYAEVTRYLREQGRLPGANDLWIAATALRHGRALVTRNAADFRRVPGLAVVTY